MGNSAYLQAGAALMSSRSADARPVGGVRHGAPLAPLTVTGIGPPLGICEDPRVAARGSSPVFVGRAGELARLEAMLDRAAAGHPGVVVIGGEAGVGKTRLVTELIERTGRSRPTPSSAAA